MMKRIGRPTDSQAFEIWNKVLDAALKIPGAQVDRASFLRGELSQHVSEEKLRSAIDSTPAKAGISKKIVRQIAHATIKRHLLRASANSFVAGLPGGWWLLGAVPLDLAQFYLNAIQLAQKLAYTYGWPQIADVDVIDEETKLQITIFLAVMMGAGSAVKLLGTLAERLSEEVGKRLPRQALTKYGLYNLSKNVAKWLGFRLTKDALGRGASKIVPIIGGFISAGVTFFTLRQMARRLQRHLLRLPLARGSA